MELPEEFRESWLSDEPASVAALAALCSAVPGLPDAYRSLLQRGNGGEASLNSEPFSLCLDSAESALDYWSSGTYTIEDAFVFGGNGGGTLYALDMRSMPWSVVSFDPIDPPGSIQSLAPDFDTFLSVVNRDVVV